jgi:hypothetical protein
MGLASDFMGTSGKKALHKSFNESEIALKEGFKGGISALEEGTDRFNEYGELGDQANRDYYASIGMLGPEEQARVQGYYTGDPIQNAINDRLARANNRWQTGRGMGNSGAAVQALTNTLYDQYDKFREKLRTGGAMGFQARSAQSALDAKRGDMTYGYGATRAQNRINYGNALMQQSQVGPANFLKVGELAVKGMGALKPTPGK